MERLTNIRARILIILFIAVVSFFAIRLYDMQVIETGGKTDNQSTFTTLTRVKAARGDILDQNGNVLVSNRASYDLVINHYVLKNATGTNNYLYQLVKRCQEQNITYTEHFPISREKPFVYTLDEYSSAWQSYFQAFLANKNLDSDITAPLLLQKLREKYKIPEEWTEEEARQVIGLWYELDLRGAVYSLPNYVFLTDVDDESLSAIVELNIPGMNVEASTVREYNVEYAAHILGYVGPMNASQWDEYKSKDGYSMDSEIGQDGLEAVYEEYLHGVDGWRYDEVTSDGTVVRSWYEDGQEPKAGSNVEVSIDINLQRAAEDTLAKVIETLRAEGGDGADAEGGAVVAMDVRTGQVLVCGSYPTYNLNTYSEDFNALNADPLAPLFNRALQGIYPPGSTFKPTMAIAGINSKTINSETPLYCGGVYTKYQGLKLYCHIYSSLSMIHEELAVEEALMVSCNLFFYQLGDMISLEAMDSTAKGFGLGESTGIELPERIGRRANAQTKQELYEEGHDGWYAADQVLAAIGQSDHLYSPLQLCVYASTLANRGTRYKATFLNRVVSSDYRELLVQNEESVLSYMEISDEAHQACLNGMIDVAHNIRGTAYSTFKNYPVTVAAKTGTAQTGDLSGSDHGAFICYAPAEDPQIAIAVYGEKAGHGGDMAEVAKAILDIYFEVGEIGDVNSYENQLS